MDMQNVSNLQIPEGAVRTIHDKDSRLLWGAVGYGTKYAGNTYQQTYSGKNLLNCNTYSGKTATADVLTGEGYVKATQNSTGSGGGNSYVYYDVDRTDLANRQVTLFAKAVSGGGSTGSRIRITEISGSPEIVRFFPTASGASNTFNMPANGKIRIYFYVNASNVTGAVGAYTEYSEVQLELGDQATPFESYVGGIASPNPDYPQDVQTVTGEQTVTISDGTNAEDFAISLGPIELCKIGDYQDYIYKSGNDWYMHKIVKKINLNGAETWQNSGTNVFACLSISDYATSGNTGFSPFAKGIGNVTNGTVFSNTAPDQSFAFGDGTIADRMYWKSSNFANANEAKSWLQSNTPDLYYALTTPTNTKITDATLVGQLNAIHQWLTRYGYNATVTGNLPIVINKTNL